MKNWNLSVVISHVLLAALFVAVLLPGEKKTAPYGAMLCAMALMEGVYLYRVMRRPGKLSSASDIMSILWALMLVWEVLVSKLDLCHPVLAPALENIFAVFSEDYLEMGRGILSSLEILLIGVVVGLALGTLLGLICGWHQRLKEVFFPYCRRVGSDSVHRLCALCHCNHADLSQRVCGGHSAGNLLAHF